MMLKRIIVVVFIGLVFYSCTSDSPEPKVESGSLKVEFVHEVDGSTLKVDTLMYLNDAGNQYLVNEIQYFISDVYLVKPDSSKIFLNNWDDIHYVDTDIKETMVLNFNEEIPVGTYKGMGFTFGIDVDKNHSLMFVNPPESFMFWPENLGGGYHYLKLNGKWLMESNVLAPFNFHLGVGQIYYSYPDSISEFVHNDFDIELTDENIIIKDNAQSYISLRMNVNNWFRTPNVYDHNFWGGDIMQNQDAMGAAVENGGDVFNYIVIK